MRATGRRRRAAIALLFVALIGITFGWPRTAAAQTSSADMATVTLSLSGSGVAAGGMTNLTMEFVNHGSANVAPGASALVTFNQAVTATVTSSPVACSGGARIACNAGSLGQGNRILVRASVRVGASAGGSLVATGRATSNLPDPNPGNNQ